MPRLVGSAQLAVVIGNPEPGQRIPRPGCALLVPYFTAYVGDTCELGWSNQIP
jgi:hypothetical protein